MTNKIKKRNLKCDMLCEQAYVQLTGLPLTFGKFSLGF